MATKSDGPRGSLRVHLVGDSAEQRAMVKVALQALGDPPLEIVEGEPKGHPPAENGALPDVTMIVFDGAEDAALEYLHQQAAQSPRPMLFALVGQRSAVMMKRVLRAGADELLFLPLDAGEATRALLKISEARLKAERREGGVVCSFASLVGGVGVTSLAGNLGLALQSELDKKVALIDLDFQTGGLAVFLNLEPEVTIMPLIRLGRKFDSIQLESALTKHPSGMYVLAAPKRIEEGELVSDVTVATAIDLLRQLFDFVIVDCGDHIDENVVAAWERSDHLFYVLDQTVAAARCAWRFIDLFERLGLSALEPHYLLNRHMPAHPLGETQVETTLARAIYAKIPRDDKVMERTELTAQDLFQVAPHSPLARSMVELAHRITPGSNEAVATQEGGLMARLFSAFSAR